MGDKPLESTCSLGGVEKVALLNYASSCVTSRDPCVGGVTWTSAQSPTRLRGRLLSPD